MITATDLLTMSLSDVLARLGWRVERDLVVDGEKRGRRTYDTTGALVVDAEGLPVETAHGMWAELRKRGIIP